VAHAKAEIAERGLVSTVTESYYAMVSAMRKYANAQQSQQEAEHFLDITRKQERGGEVAHSDSVKAEIQFVQRQRDTSESQLGLDKARIGLAVLLFPDFRQDFTVVDDLDTPRPLPVFTAIQALAGEKSPDIRAAQAAVEQQRWEIKSSRAALLPTLSADYFFGINANQFALHNPEGYRNIGSVVQAQLNIPSGPGARRAAASNNRNCASSRPRTISASPIASSSPTSTRSTWRRLPPIRKSLPCAIPWTFPPRASS